MTDHYAVIGNPIAHSKSPQIHRMFAEQTGQDISYVAIESPLDGFAAVVHRLREEGYKGCNVTVPFKEEAFRLAEPTPRAHDAEAVNTLKFEQGRTIGDNTDGVGLVTDIENNLKICLAGKHVLLIGAGGAARGAIHCLLAASPASMVIYNRTLERAARLKKAVNNREQFRSIPVEVAEFGKLGTARFDAVINATTSGLTDSEIPLPPNCFGQGSLAYDMVYGRDTVFMKFARRQGAGTVCDGLGMLVEQAAEAFFLWRGIRPATSPVIAALR